MRSALRSDLDELIVRRAEADGLAVLDGGAPVGVRMRGGEVVEVLDYME